MTDPTETTVWKQLQSHRQRFAEPDYRLQALFASQPHRFSDFSISMDQLLFDFSKNLITVETLDLLIALARECQLPQAITAMFAGETVNNTENRAALHVALRASSESNPEQHTKPEVTDTLNRMEAIVSAVRGGKWRGHSGKPISDVVNIGIGGSDLGPAMVTQALTGYADNKLKLHFVSNIDPDHINSTLVKLSPETTLFIIASKSFTTIETHQNANLARAWLLAADASETDLQHHFLAISSNLAAAREFGIADDNVLPMWDWVGGRYSLWSAIGLPIAMALGMDQFRQLLAGATTMDQHFLQTDLRQNIPVIMGLLAVWYNGFFDAGSHAVIPYSQKLQRLPAFLQQLCMESLGKSVQKNGDDVHTASGEVVWGEPGSNAQHSFFQLLHQGTHMVPIDFIAIAKGENASNKQQHSILLANCFGQSMALMQGKSIDNIEQELRSTQTPEDTIAKITSHKSMAGNKPSNTLLLRQLSPYSLGALIALYEHKVYVQSVIWNVNAFDQWGVELGKTLSAKLIDELTEPAAHPDYDDSTNNLIGKVKQWTR